MNHKRVIVVYIIMIIVFAAIFFLAFFNLQRNEALFGIGIPPEFENWLTMILCVGSIVKVVWELYVLERD